MIDLQSEWLPGVSFLLTNRLGGVSQKPYESFNLAQHVGDDSAQVSENRNLLAQTLEGQAEPLWLNQVHGNQVLEVPSAEVSRDFDASYTKASGLPLVIMVADCLPILLADRKGGEIAALHAGWKGLANGVIENTISCFDSEDIVAWIGPGIGACHYEVDQTLVDAFPGSLEHFTPSKRPEHWMFDLLGEARSQLSALGVKEIRYHGACTYCDEQFYSYRRDGVTGRFAVVIWKT